MWGTGQNPSLLLAMAEGALEEGVADDKKWKGADQGIDSRGNYSFSAKVNHSVSSASLPPTYPGGTLSAGAVR